MYATLILLKGGPFDGGFAVWGGDPDNSTNVPPIEFTLRQGDKNYTYKFTNVEERPQGDVAAIFTVHEHQSINNT